MQVIELKQHSFANKAGKSDINLKLLNSEHFIVSANTERMGKISLFYSHSRNAIVINEKLQYIDQIVELIVLYLDSENLKKKEIIEYVEYEQCKEIKKCFVILNRIARIRRRLYKGIGH